jgi:hypothetical protein
MTVNSIKNAIVTVTLLAVGYGAYVVLHEPPPEELAQEEGLPAANMPEVSVEIDASSPGLAEQVAEGGALLADAEAAAPDDHAADTPGGALHPYDNAEPVALSALPGQPADSDDRAAQAPQQASYDVDGHLPADHSLGPIPPAEGSQGFEDAWLKAEEHLQHGDLVESLALLSDWYWDTTLSSEQAARLIEVLDQLAGTVIYSREHLLEPEYQVQPGETLADIAVRYQVPEELLAKINGIALPYAVTSGTVLKVVRGPFRADLSLPDRQLTIFLGRFYAGRFDVLLGRDLPPHDAVYEVAERTDGRSYFDRRMGREVLKGEAENRYGDHWLGLRGDQITAGHSVGIHGRPAGSDINDEDGCISLAPHDAEDVHAILSVGSRIQVRR